MSCLLCTCCAEMGTYVYEAQFNNNKLLLIEKNEYKL